MTNISKYMRLLALGITFSASMALPYVHIKFYDVIREATQATNNELGLLMTIFTGVGMLLYIPGGVLADRGSPKKLLITSLAMMAALNTIFAVHTSYAMALLMNICHNVTVQSDYTKTGYWKEKETNPQASYNQLFVPQIELYQKTLGIIGLGAIGLWTARMAKGFGMKVIANSRNKKTGPQYDGIEQVSMEEIFERSDVISIHCPHTKETENLLNREAFAKMKDGVIIINTARGIIIDEEALLEALESRKVYMAGLDVVANEPPQYQIPLMQSPYTFITSHIAWQPKAARLRAVDLAMKNFRSYLEGMPTSVIN